MASAPRRPPGPPGPRRDTALPFPEADAPPRTPVEREATTAWKAPSSGSSSPTRTTPGAWCACGPGPAGAGDRGRQPARRPAGRAPAARGRVGGGLQVRPAVQDRLLRDDPADHPGGDRALPRLRADRGHRPGDGEAAGRGLRRRDPGGDRARPGPPAPGAGDRRQAERVDLRVLRRPARAQAGDALPPEPRGADPPGDQDLQALRRHRPRRGQDRPVPARPGGGGDRLRHRGLDRRAPGHGAGRPGAGAGRRRPRAGRGGRRRPRLPAGGGAGRGGRPPAPGRPGRGRRGDRAPGAGPRGGGRRDQRRPVLRSIRSIGESGLPRLAPRRRGRPRPAPGRAHGPAGRADRDRRRAGAHLVRGSRASRSRRPAARGDPPGGRRQGAGDHRRAGHRQDHPGPGDRRDPEAQGPAHPPRRSHRPRRQAPGAGDRHGRLDDPPPARVRSA